MVTVKLMGGLGNQMFQYAIGRSLAQDLGEKLFLDVSFYDMIHVNATARHYELHHLNIQGKLFTPGFISKYWKYFLNFIIKRCPTNYHNYVIEKNLSYSPIIIGDKKNPYLDGYWQCEKYFKHNEDLIRRDFQVVAPQSCVNKRWSDIILKSSSVCLHVRRGDYVTDSGANQIYGTRSTDYYDKAIAHISNYVDKPVFFVFSDDLEWTKTNLSIPYEVHYMDQNGPDEDYEDLRLMTQCKYYIIANSTFSWWGAWLGNYVDKIVVCPKNWFNDPDMKTDIIPDSWVKI